MKQSAMPQHKAMAAGEKVNDYARGGLVDNRRVLKSGKPDSPVELAKRRNMVPGYKKGGKAC